MSLKITLIGLEGGRNVAQPKVHHHILDMLVLSVECSLPLIPFLNLDQVIGPTEVHLSEDFEAKTLEDSLMSGS